MTRPRVIPDPNIPEFTDYLPERNGRKRFEGASTYEHQTFPTTEPHLQAYNSTVEWTPHKGLVAGSNPAGPTDKRLPAFVWCLVAGLVFIALWVWRVR